MPDHTDNPTHRFKLSSCAIWAAIPLVLFLALILTYTINNRPPSIRIPTPKMPADNAFGYFEKAYGLMKNPEAYDYRQPMNGPAPAAAVDPMLASAYDAPVDSFSLAQLKRLADDDAPARAQFRLALQRDYLQPNLDTRPLAYRHFRGLARCVETQARYELVRGRHSEACGALLDVMQFGTAIQHGAWLLFAQNGVSIQAGAALRLERILRALSPDELQAVATRLADIQRKHVPFSDVLRWHGAYVTAILAATVNETADQARNPARWFDSYWFEGDDFRSGPDPSHFWPNARYAMTNKARLIQSFGNYYNQVAREQEAPYSGKSAIAMPYPEFTYMIADASDIDHTRADFARAEAFTTILQTEVALLRYHADHSTYPAHLSDLAPKYLKTIPTDPFGQTKPLIYRPTNNANSFLLYSRGPNMKDNGGVPGKWAGSKTRGDIVAGKLIQARQPAPL